MTSILHRVPSPFALMRNGASSEALDRYLDKVGQKLRANQEYPSMARRMNLTGTVHIRLHIDNHGTVDGRTISVTRCSGAEILDEAGLAAVRRAAPFPPPPGGESLLIVVPVVFGPCSG